MITAISTTASYARLRKKLHEAQFSPYNDEQFISATLQLSEGETCLLCKLHHFSKLSNSEHFKQLRIFFHNENCFHTVLTYPCY